MGNDPSHSQEFQKLYDPELHRHLPPDPAFPTLPLLARIKTPSTFALVVRPIDSNLPPNHPNILSCIQSRELGQNLYEMYEWSERSLRGLQQFLVSNNGFVGEKELIKGLIEGCLSAYSYLSESNNKCVNVRASAIRLFGNVGGYHSNFNGITNHLTVKVVPRVIFENYHNSNDQKLCVHQGGTQTDITSFCHLLLNLCNLMMPKDAKNNPQAIQKYYGSDTQQLIAMMMANKTWKQVRERARQLREGVRPRIFVMRDGDQTVRPIIPHQPVIYINPPYIRDISPIPTKSETPKVLFLNKHQQANLGTYSHQKLAFTSVKHTSQHQTPRQNNLPGSNTNSNTNLQNEKKQISTAQSNTQNKSRSRNNSSVRITYVNNKQADNSKIEASIPFLHGKPIQFAPSIKSQPNQNIQSVPVPEYTPKTKVNGQQKIKNRLREKQKQDKNQIVILDFEGQKIQENPKKEQEIKLKSKTLRQLLQERKKQQAVSFSFNNLPHPIPEQQSQPIDFALTPNEPNSNKKKFEIKSIESEEIVVNAWSNEEPNRSKNDEDLMIIQAQAREKVVNEAEYTGGVTSEGVRQGHGKLYFQGGGSYAGEIHDNKISGFGKLFYSSGRLAYQGYFKDNFPNGYGKIYSDTPIHIDSLDCTNLTQFQNRGQAKNPFLEYEGVRVLWKFYEGQVENNLREGRGILMLENGEKFQGEFRGNKIQGGGIFYGKQEVVKGIWKGSRLVKRYN